jgi:sugar phosphate isomerase/epimerase
MDRKIGAQYYTLRDYAKTIEDFDDTCRKVSEMGYKIVQISGTPLGAAEMKEVLDKYDLKVVVTHRNFNDFKNNLDEIIEYNKTLGCYLCGVGAMPGEARESVEGLDQFIKDANEISAKLKKEGLYFGYHNHHFEFAKLDGKLIMDRLINETNPDEFMFIVDTYWLQFGGVNPVDFIKKLGKRAMMVHFKDYHINPEKNFTVEMCEVGEGNLNWDEIICACDEAGAQYALVEQDICNRNPFESLKMSYDFLKSKGFY